MAVPDWEPAGVTLTVRFVPLPPKVMPLVGAKVGFDEAAERVKFAGGVSLSLTVKPIGPVELFIAIA